MSTGNDVIDSLVKQWNQKLNSVGPKAVLINLGVTAAFSAVVILTFSLLRPNNQIVYAPKYKYSPDDKRPPKVSKSFFSWIVPLVSVKEAWMMDRIGMDATVYLRFLRMLRWMFLILAAMCCAVLIPANVIYNVKNVDTGTRNFLSMLSIQSVDGPLLYLHVAVTYIIHGIVYLFIWLNYKRVVELRWQYFRSPDFQDALFSRSVMITHLSKRLRTDAALDGYLRELNIPYPTESVHVDRRIDELPELIEQHSDAVRQLEQVLTTYLKKGTIPEKRPTLKRGGFLGMGGESHDAIDFLTARIQRLENRIEQMQEHIEQSKTQQYGFASFEKAPYAQMVAKKLEGKKFKGAVVELAPRPQDLIWKNLEKSDGQRRSHAFFGGLLLAAVMVLYTAPLIAVSAVSNLASLTVYVPFLNDWSNESPITFSAVAGVLPPFLAIVLQLILPIIMRSLARFQGATTRTRLDRAVLARYFFFLVVFQFFVFSLLSVFFNLITEIVLQKGHVDFVLKELSRLPQKIQNAYVVQGNYWLTWYPTRMFSAIFELAQIVSLLYTYVRAKLFGRTPRQVREWCAPAPYDFSVYATNVLFMCLVALVYAPLVPLVTLAAAGAFFASSFVAKYMLLYVNATKVESGGRLWRMLINRLLFCLIIMQLLMCLTIALQLRYINCIAAAPPVFAVFGFKWYLNRRFGEKFKWFIPSPQETADIRPHHSSGKKLAKRFGHPSLHAKLMTPMVHKDIEHLLAQVYRGRLGAESPMLAEDKGGKALVNAGGLTFAAIESQDLELSRDEYLRQKAEDDWETGSMASSAALGSATSPSQTNLLQKGYFDNQRQQYLARGPGGYPALTPGNESMYSRPTVQRPGSMASQENLLAYAAPFSQSAHYPPYPAPSAATSYADLTPGMTASRSSVDLSAYTDPRESLRYSRAAYPEQLYQPQAFQSPPRSSAAPYPQATRSRNSSIDTLNNQQYWSSAPSYHTTADPSYPPAPSSTRSTPPPGLPLGAQQRSASPSSNLTFGGPPAPGSPRLPDARGHQPRPSSGSQASSNAYWQSQQPYR